MAENGWRKAKASGGDGNNCVEVRKQAGCFQMRDSKLGDASPIFNLGHDTLTALIRSAQR
ncbi:hypothetical protein GCM10029992_62520 [Glycomyces albus]